MPTINDAKNFLGLLFHGMVHCVCEVSDKGTGNITNTLGITPLLRSFGQSIADNLASDHFKEIFNVKRIEALLKNKHPQDINHDLEKLFKAAAIKTISYIKAMLEAEWKEGTSGIQGMDRETWNNTIQPILIYLQEQQNFLQENSDLIAVDYEDIDNHDAFLERISSHVLFYEHCLPLQSAEKLVAFYTSHLPYCFNLAFQEALKDDNNAKGFKAFQLRYMEDSKKILQSNVSMLQIIDKKIDQLEAGNHLISKSVLEELFTNALTETKPFLGNRLNNLEKLLLVQHEELTQTMQGGFEKLNQLSQNNQELIRLLVEKEEKIKALEKQLGLHPDTALQAILHQLLEEKSAIEKELHKSEEIRHQQQKDKTELEQRLNVYQGNNELKEKALDELKNGNYGEAKNYLLLSAQESIATTANTFYELGKINKLQFNYQEALKYVDLAVKIDGQQGAYLWELASLLGILGHYDKQLTCLQQLVEAIPKNDCILINYYNDIGCIYMNKGEYNKAIQYLQKGLFLNKKGEINEQTNAMLYNNLGNAYHYKGEYNKAIDYYQQAGNINKEMLGEEHIDIATHYNNMGLVHHAKGEYDKAIDYFQKAWNINKKLLGEEHLEIAKQFINLGLTYDSIGEYDKAIDYYKKALNIYTKFLGEEHPDIALHYNNTGLAYCNKGEYTIAIDYFQKAKNIFEKFLGNDHPDIAMQYGNLGLASYKKGEYDKAIGYFQQALNIFQKFFGNNHPHIALLYHNLGETWNNKGEYEKAIAYYQKALNISKKIQGKEHPDIAGHYAGLGNTYINRGKYNKAIDFFQKALSIWKKFISEEHPYIAVQYHGLGLAYYSKGNYDKAMEYYLKALNINKKILSEGLPETAKQYTNIGLIYYMKGEYDKAIDHYQQGLYIYKKFLGEEHPDIARQYYIWGLTYHTKGEYDKAIEYYQKTQDMAIKFLPPNHPVIVETEKNLGAALKKQLPFQVPYM